MHVRMQFGTPANILLALRFVLHESWDSPTLIFLKTPLWVNCACVHALSKTPPKNLVGKKEWRKEYIVTTSCIALVDSLKTLREKLQENSPKKRAQQCLQDICNLPDCLTRFFGNLSKDSLLSTCSLWTLQNYSIKATLSTTDA